MNVMQLILFLFFALISSTSVADAADVSCKTAECHSRIGGTQNTHAPVKDEDCTSCHKQTSTTHPQKGAKSFTLTSEGAALCYQCHDRYGKKKVVHPPVKDGECAYCHHPHGGVGRFLLANSDDMSELCFGCHNAEPFNQKIKHGPVAVGECTKCHDPHESSEKKLLKGAAWVACIKCHVGFKEALKDVVMVHPPVKNGPCTGCHNPHSSPNEQLLKVKMPDICFGCHNSIKKKMSQKFVHKPVVQENGCTSCHAAHASKFGKLLSGEQKEVCLNCHGSDKLGTPPLRNIKKDIEGKKYLHGPIKRGECSPCHDPHASDNFRLLKGKYPAELYAPYKDGIYGFCLTCHEKNLLRFSETTIYTKFRNGSRNLHYVHVVNRKGRTCRICHQAHASTGEKLISNEGTMFGEWNIPLNFKTTPTGGSCAPGCHRPFSYDREKAVKY